MTAATNLQSVTNAYPIHWEAYKQKSWVNLEFDENQTPFFNTSVWDSLSDEQKRELAWGFVQLNAEVIIHLEQGLLLSSKVLEKRGLKLDQGMKEFISDEILHIDEFRKFLSEESKGCWPETSFFLHQKSWSRKFCAWLYRWEPLAVFLPGAKSEIYAVQYHVALSKNSKIENRWASLVKHHAIDEASHIAKDFELLRDEIQKMTLIQRVRLHVATLMCVLMTQVCLISPAWKLMSRVFYKENTFKKFYLFSKFISWVLWIHPAFPATRKVFSKLIHKESDSYFKHFAFLGW
ncbi:MAG: diiron oxygenase [Bacteriovoracaceae bacterium]|nr:diiron oxygenase [Bacteriovoracaceae bacterium]